MMYIIEHLEPEMYEWCVLEYRHMSETVGKGSLWLTNVKKGAEKVKGFGKVFRESVAAMGLKNLCLLDQDAKHALKPSDSKKFRYLIFGGILGDFPRRKRTEAMLGSRLKCERRHLGKKQMTTDTAVMAAHMIMAGKPLSKMPFADNISLEIGDRQGIRLEVRLPYRYIKAKGKPVIPGGLLKYLKDSEMP